MYVTEDLPSTPRAPSSGKPKRSQAASEAQVVTNAYTGEELIVLVFAGSVGQTVVGGRIGIEGSVSSHRTAVPQGQPIPEPGHLGVLGLLAVLVLRRFVGRYRC